MWADINHNQLNNELKVVFNYLKKIGVSSVDAQDIVQETAYKFLLYYETIRSKNIRSWIFRVALNLLRDHHRKNTKITIGFSEDCLINSPNESPEEILITKEESQLIQKIITKMKPKHSELIILKYFLELKYSDISTLLDMKETTIKTYLARARKEFNEHYRRETREK
jgi:RNA polymerase sigma-70 factor, ECF subfamily